MSSHVQRGYVVRVVVAGELHRWLEDLLRRQHPLAHADGKLAQSLC